jgi:hypothetical protein
VLVAAHAEPIWRNVCFRCQTLRETPTGASADSDPERTYRWSVWRDVRQWRELVLPRGPLLLLLSAVCQPVDPPTAKRGVMHLYVLAWRRAIARTIAKVFTGSGRVV